MDLERHPLYRCAEQIFRLTRGSLGWRSEALQNALKIAVFGAAFSVMPTVAMAQEATAGPTRDVPEVVLYEADCRALVAYTDTTAAAYQPGVDVHGRPVVGANVSDQRPGLVPDEITFTLTLQLGAFAPGLAAGLADSTAPIGEITVRGQEVFLNGYSLNTLQTEALAAQCQNQIDTRTLD